MTNSFSAPELSGVNVPVWETDWIASIWNSLTNGSFNGIGDAGQWSSAFLLELQTSTTTQDIIGTSGRDTLVGTDANERLIGGTGADILIGGDGNDIFVYNSLRDAGDRIVDFTAGEDKIDLSGLLNSLGYNGSDPLGDSYLRLVDQGAGTTSLEVDSNGSTGGASFRSFITVQGPNGISASDLLPQPPVAPQITASLVNDTGSLSTDQLTADPQIQGTIVHGSEIVKFQAKLNTGPSVDVLAKLNANGDFVLDEATLTQVNGGQLIDGAYRLSMAAEDAQGNVSIPILFDFTLDRTAPGLSLTSPLAAGTHSSYVHLLGSVEEAGKLTATLENNTSVALEMTAAGDFDQQLQALPLSAGSHQLSVSLTDAAGNRTQQVVDFAVSASPFVIGTAGTQGWAAQSVTADTTTVLLGEANSFVTQAQIPVTLGQSEGSRTLRFAVDANFDKTDVTAASEDTFAVYLVDANNPSQTLLDNGTAGTPVFSLTGDVAEFTPGLVRYDGQFVEIDLTSLASESQGLLRFQLLNQDGDTGSQIQVSDLTNTVDPEGIAAIRFESNPTLATAGSALNLGGLTLSDSVEAVFSDIRFSPQTGTYVARVQLRNNGDIAISRQAAVVFNDLPAGVSLQNASGTDAAGNPYVNLVNAIRPGGLAAGALSDAIEVTFSNSEQLRLALQPQVYVGGPNRAPVFAPIGTVEVMPGQRLEIPLLATDPDGDRVTFALRSQGDLPKGKFEGTGNLVFEPTTDQLGTYTFILVATDGGLETEQTVTLNVVADPIKTTRVSGQVLDTNGNPLVNLAHRARPVADGDGCPGLLYDYVAPDQHPHRRDQY